MYLFKALGHYNPQVRIKPTSPCHLTRSLIANLLYGADDGLPGPYELFEPFLHFKPVEWLVTKASWEAEPLSTHSSRLESGEPNETRSV